MVNRFAPDVDLEPVWSGQLERAGTAPSLLGSYALKDRSAWPQFSVPERPHRRTDGPPRRRHDKIEGRAVMTKRGAGRKGREGGNWGTELTLARAQR